MVGFGGFFPFGFFRFGFFGGFFSNFEGTVLRLWVFLVCLGFFWLVGFCLFFFF